MAEPLPVLADGEAQGVPVAVQVDPEQLLHRPGSLALDPDAARTRPVNAAARRHGLAQALMAAPGQP